MVETPMKAGQVLRGTDSGGYWESVNIPAKGDTVGDIVDHERPDVHLSRGLVRSCTGSRCRVKWTEGDEAGTTTCVHPETLAVLR